MAKNDANNRIGMLGELNVARAFIEQGCAVNFLTFMDVGMDLHVHMPANLEAAKQTDKSWEMSGYTAHVQVKSTNGNRLPAISVNTADTWSLGTQIGNPTLLVAVIVADPEKPVFRLFDPLVVDSYAQRARSKGKTKFTMAVEEGVVVEPTTLFNEAVHWISNGRYLLSPVIPRPWGEGVEIWEGAVEIVVTLTVMFERRFREAAESVDRFTYEDTALNLISQFLEGAGVCVSNFDERLSNSTEILRNSLIFRVHDAVNEAGGEKHGWADHVEQLALVASAYDEAGSLSQLGDICYAYGKAVRGKLQLPDLTVSKEPTD